MDYLVQRFVSPDFNHSTEDRFGSYAAVLVYAVGAISRSFIRQTSEFA